MFWLQLYESTRFTDAGFRHHELYFPDGSCPPDHILQQFLAISEQEQGMFAGHRMSSHMLEGSRQGWALASPGSGTW